MICQPENKTLFVLLKWKKHTQKTIQLEWLNSDPPQNKYITQKTNSSPTRKHLDWAYNIVNAQRLSTRQNYNFISLNRFGSSWTQLTFCLPAVNQFIFQFFQHTMFNSEVTFLVVEMTAFIFFYVNNSLEKKQIA